MNKRRIKETKGLAQGHTGRKRQPQDRNSSSSSPESKFSARGALLCTCVCTEAGASADDSELSWNPPAHTNHCHLRVKPISQNYSHRQRKVERERAILVEYAPFLKEKEMELKVSLTNLFTSYWLKLYHITTCSCRRLRK